ncbi:tetratricopeptide repeat protein [Bacillus sp. NPDC094106]|uniref:response regulator aspartate phosphatase n=1 Tax=Bacillus sp. NPDC094106 TaxID=3363949 RepID=UPI003812D2D5
MHTGVLSNESLIKLLDEWYREIRKQNMDLATKLKNEVENSMKNIDSNADLLFYYHLLEFRHAVLTNGINISKDSFSKIDEFEIPSDNLLSYYYHLFKAIHSTFLFNVPEAQKHFDEAYKRLKDIPDKLEKAEFHYRISVLYHHNNQSILAIQNAWKAKEIYEEHSGNELNIASCENAFASSCVHLKQFEQAEESYNTAINILQKANKDMLVLRIRNNLGWLYASQNLSELAIRHLSEVSEKIPNHFKAIFLQAREYYKLKEGNIAEELIEKGTLICNGLGNEEYKWHFAVLRELNTGTSIEETEEVIKSGLAYFEKESLWEYVQEYSEMLAVKYYSVDNHLKASHYFYKAHEAKKELDKKGALK